MKRSVFALSVSLISTSLLMGCVTSQSTVQSTSTTDQARYEQALSEARDALKQASAVGGEWRDSKKIFAKAEKSAAAGDYAEAIKLAEQAHEQGASGYHQAMSQRQINPSMYMR